MFQKLRINTATALMAGCMALASCVEEVTPTDSILPSQVASMEKSQEAMLNGLVAYVNDFNTYGSSVYYTNDYGYPCQMMFREVQGSDFPVSGGAYNYWVTVENSTGLMGLTYYTYYYYYRFILNCNKLIGVIGPSGTASAASRHYLGCAQAFRALCYLDMARTFEYQQTGVAALDNEAAELGIKGLTVPIVTENTSEETLKHNPRAPFYTMYRFILNDLNQAEANVAGYSRPDGTYPNSNVVYGLKARFWLEAATRFDNSAEDLATQLRHEGDNDGYTPLAITSADDCYRKAAEYARKARNGFSPMTKEEWTNPQTGFNTATKSWIFYTSIKTKEQEGNYYSSIMGTVCTEAEWSMCQYGGGNYRCIGSWLYNNIDEHDWRKNSWIAPADAGSKTPNPKYRTVANDSLFATFPAYANLKFRARDVSSGGIVEGMKCDIPLMRMEEMLMIEAEAVAHTEGVAAGVQLLTDFLNDYRYVGGEYSSAANDIEDFINELMIQRRIEFWGEGINFFDYKRLKLQVCRKQNSNYINNQKNDSKMGSGKYGSGFVCPTMNYYISTSETNNNTAVKRNPDPTNWHKK